MVSALPNEIAGVRGALTARRSLGVAEVPNAEAGTLGGRPAVVASLGMGRKPTERGLAALLGACTPRACVGIGFAGGCDPTLGPGAVIAPDRLLCEPCEAPAGRPIPGREPLDVTDPRIEPALERLSRHLRFALERGASVTVNVVATPRAKESLYRNLGARACDMETYWAARACASAQVPFVALRVIFDRVWERLPEIPPDRPGAAIARRPWLLAYVPKLAWRFLTARRALDRAALELARLL